MSIFIIYPPLSPAHAFPAHVALNDMNEEQRYAYLAGYAEMGHFLLANSGRKEMGECLIGWFYTDKKGYNVILGFFRNNPDKEVVPLIWLAMKKYCGPKSSQNYGLVRRDAPPRTDTAFISGHIEMAAVLSSIDGKKEHRDCILDWFYRDEESARTIVNANRKNPQFALQQILDALISRECGVP